MWGEGMRNWLFACGTCGYHVTANAAHAPRILCVPCDAAMEFAGEVKTFHPKKLAGRGRKRGGNDGGAA